MIFVDQNGNEVGGVNFTEKELEFINDENFMKFVENSYNIARETRTSIMTIEKEQEKNRQDFELAQKEKDQKFNTDIANCVKETLMAALPLMFGTDGAIIGKKIADIIKDEIENKSQTKGDSNE